MSFFHSNRWPYLNWDDPTSRLAALMVLAAGMVVVLCLSQVVLVPTLVLATLAVLIVGGIRWSATPVLVFLATASLLVWTPGHFLGALPVHEPASLPESLLAMALIVYVALHYRLARIAEMARSAPEFKRPSEGDMWFRLARIVCVAGAATATARFAWPYLYVGRALYEDFRLNYILAGFLFGMLLGGGVLFLLTAIVRLIGRRGMNREEARMVLNETVFREHHQDLRRMVRRIPRSYRSIEHGVSR